MVGKETAKYLRHRVDYLYGKGCTHSLNFEVMEAFLVIADLASIPFWPGSLPLLSMHTAGPAAV